MKNTWKWIAICALAFGLVGCKAFEEWLDKDTDGDAVEAGQEPVAASEAPDESDGGAEDDFTPPDMQIGEATFMAPTHSELEAFWDTVRNPTETQISGPAPEIGARMRARQARIAQFKADSKLGETFRGLLATPPGVLLGSDGELFALLTTENADRTALYQAFAAQEGRPAKDVALESGSVLLGQVRFNEWHEVRGAGWKFVKATAITDE